MKKTIKGEPVRVGVAMLVSAASSQVPVHLRLVYRESGLFLNRVWLQVWSWAIAETKKVKVSFLAPITQHIFHICVLTLVVLCGQKKQQKKQSFAIAIAHFQFSSQTRVDG